MSKFENPLGKVFLKILEDWAMMLVDPAESGTNIFDLDKPLYVTYVRIHGAFSGTLSIVAQRDFISALTSNLVGSDQVENLDEEQLSDAFREMGNVLAGNFITEAYGDDVAFDILQPKVEPLSPEKLQNLTKAQQSYFFVADDAPVCATFLVEK